jgi:hypothetical protein
MSYRPSLPTEHDLAWTREIFRPLEILHDVIYFSPHVRTAFQAIGTTSRWMTYFGARSAPLGAASAELVEATFYNFKPEMIARYVPALWEVITPDEFCSHRQRIAADALTTDHPEIVEFPLPLLELLEEAVSRAEVGGLPLFSGNRALVARRDGTRVERLWNVATAIREHRGDGHVASLLVGGIDGLSAHLLRGSSERLSKEMLTTVRGWEDYEIDQAIERLIADGLLTNGGELSERGRELRQRIEHETDRTSFRLLHFVPDEQRAEILDALRKAAAPIPSVLHDR